MKRIVYILTLLLISATNSLLRAQSEIQPTLRGDTAVNQLKQTGDYDSLKQAIKNARLKDGQNGDAENAPDAIGQSAKLTASDGGANDFFGARVAVSGDTAIVGAKSDDVSGNGDQGSAYIFVRSGIVWLEQAHLFASDGAANDLFGANVAIDGDTAIVGAPQDNVGGDAERGSAYVFVRSGTTWTQQQKLTANDGAAMDFFGSGTAILGDKIVVGAEGDNISGDADRGSAYIFVRFGTNWTQQQKIIASDGAAGDLFGSSVAAAGDSIIVGAPYKESLNTGAAYVFRQDGASATQEAKLLPVVTSTVYLFGSSVAIEGDTAIIGSPNDTISGHGNPGVAYVFKRAGTTWSEFQDLDAPDLGNPGDHFGSSVSISGSTLIIGSENDDVGTNDDQGSAYVFVRSGGVWILQRQLTAADGDADDLFGASVAISGDNIIVGAYGKDGGANSNQGAAYIFRVLNNDNWTQEAKRIASDAAANNDFGGSVAVSGDTAVVGAAGYNISQGTAYVFVRSGTIWTQQAQLFASDGEAGDSFGYSVAVSGDTIIVGANTDTVGTNQAQGSAYIFKRNNAGAWNQQAHLQPTNNVNDEFGFSVAIFGETAVVGSAANDITSNADQGSAHVFVRSGNSWSLQQRLVASDGAPNDYFGYSVGIYGDTIVVGAPQADIGANSNQGAAYTFVRSETTWMEQQKLFAPDHGAADDLFGNSAAISGDTLIVGSFGNTVNGNFQQGSAHIFTRTGTTWTQQQRLLANNGVALDFFGNSVAIDGDTAVIGANGRSSNKGAVFVFERTDMTWTQKIRLLDATGAADDQFGFSVSISGDKIVAGSPYSNDTGGTPFAKTGNEKSALAPNAASQGAAVFFVNGLAPTAATASIGGRVFTAKGRGLANARVYLTDASGETRTTITNPFGCYHFADVGTGQTIIITVVAKRYNFAPQVVNVTEDESELNFFGGLFP